MADAYIISAVRTPVGRAYRGALKNTRPDEMAAAAITEAVKRIDGLKPADIDDVVLGCAMPEAEQGMNVARISLLRAGLPNSVTGITLNRFCSSGLEAIAYAASQIQRGPARVVIGGGTESMTMIPMGGHKVSPNPTLVAEFPEVYISMGLTAERVAERFGVSREDQDRFALSSHEKAVRALDEKKFEEEIVPLNIRSRTVDDTGKIRDNEVRFDVDEGPRRDTSLEALASLRPAFKVGGTVTAGNSSQMSDGAAALVLVSKTMAKKLGVRPLARFVAYDTAGVDPDIMGIGPVAAVPKVLKKAKLALPDIGLIELNEAFASQALCVARELGIPEETLNVNGGAIALGHPLGCTGAKLTCTILYEMKRRGVEFGLVTMCIGGGMGAAGIFQLLE
ncbi:MAG: acetyl-CoA C-acyltransferase [Candidatus Latescibacteria bacterium]|nr:acetyl-CoA C-acyltransferase [Candidatus Latescibacterota bacterium]NIM21789.1 acetyl-CoA C-acyltransferase [Candidatus Latescibacterota bacterium]NIM65927.1 acetyl-CoA C-acyltransferase [Candidatus Latescibacterota bacterium]NIO02672.1 acetyl-CoA C-acyltransferase [Candidatus Latescibacterota bacterium]NIO29653.1 acetyl-CoA C-acyltransferase [Candidatus Latescibacterota bacterium]